MSFNFSELTLKLLIYSALSDNLIFPDDWVMSRVCASGNSLDYEDCDECSRASSKSSAASRTRRQHCVPAAWHRCPAAWRLTRRWTPSWPSQSVARHRRGRSIWSSASTVPLRPPLRHEFTDDEVLWGSVLSSHHRRRRSVTAVGQGSVRAPQCNHTERLRLRQFSDAVNCV